MKVLVFRVERVTAHENVVDFPERFLKTHHVLLVRLVIVIFHYREEFRSSHAAQNCSFFSKLVPNLHHLGGFHNCALEMFAGFNFVSALSKGDLTVVDSSFIVTEWAL